MTYEFIKTTYPLCNISKVTNCDIKSGLIYAYQASIDYGQTQFHPEMELVAYDVSPQEEIAEALQLALREVAFNTNTSSKIRFDAALYDYIFGVIKVKDENVSNIVRLDTRLLLILKYAFDDIIDLSKVHRAHMIEAKRVAKKIINDNVYIAT